MVQGQRKKKRYDDCVTGFDKEQNNLENNGSANQDASKSLNKRSTPSISGKSRRCVETSAESDDEETSRRRLPSPPPVRKSPRKLQGREQFQIQLPPKKRAKTNELSAAVSRPSQIYEDLSSDDEENETESIPRRSARKHKDSRPKDSSPTQRNSSPTQRRRMTALPPLESDDSERPVDMRSPSTPTASGYPMPTERFQRRAIQLLVEIRDYLRKGDHGRRVEEEQREFEVPECDQIPEFEEFDNSLDDKELQKKMKTKMRLIGGTSLGDHVKNAMKRCMTNGLMAKMSLKGKKGKYAFENTNICRIIKDGVIQSHPNATEANIFDEMSRFLKYAPGRIGGGGRGKES